LGLSSAGVAQDAGNAQRSSKRLIEKVVVTAQKREENLQEVPIEAGGSHVLLCQSALRQGMFSSLVALGVLTSTELYRTLDHDWVGSNALLPKGVFASPQT